MIPSLGAATTDAMRPHPINRRPRKNLDTLKAIALAAD